MARMQKKYASVCSTSKYATSGTGRAVGTEVYSSKLWSCFAGIAESMRSWPDPFCLFESRRLWDSFFVMSNELR